MYCPQCHVEYRPGFRRCTDCDVDLVDSPPNPGGASKVSLGGSLELLWEGEDLALFESLLDQLHDAGIRHFDQPLSTYPGVRRRDYFPVQPLMRFGYQVAVLSSDFESAKEILKRLLEDGAHGMELEAQDERKGAESGRAERTEETETCEIWSGSNKSLAEFMMASLEENGVPTRVERHDEKVLVYVLPADEARAKEVVREIVEGMPPE
jgi:hypothetical protein